MKFIKNIEDFVKNLQSLPENRKKVIIFTIVGISAVIMFFWGVKSTALHISKIEDTPKLINLNQIILEDSKEFDSTKENNIIDQNLSLPINNDLIIEEEKLLAHKNEKYNFTINYPKSWHVDNNQTNDLHIWIQKEILTEATSLHIEILDKSEKIKSTKDGVNYIISQMKDITREEKIKIGDLDGYEVVGKICTGICKGLPSDPYFPFSVIYFSKNDVVIKVKYSEGTIGMGWKDTIDDWKFYSEYKNIISTFKFIPTP